MKLESLKKFQSEMIDKEQMSNVFGGNARALTPLNDGGAETSGGEICALDYGGSTNGTCVTYTSDWSEPGHLTTLYGTSDNGKPC
jgi:hypothetical protein